MGDRVRTTTPDGRLRIVHNTTVGEDIRQTVKDLARLATPRVLRQRKNDIEAQERRYEGQTTDSNNKY